MVQPAADLHLSPRMGRCLLDPDAHAGPPRHYWIIDPRSWVHHPESWIPDAKSGIRRGLFRAGCRRRRCVLYCDRRVQGAMQFHGEAPALGALRSGWSLLTHSFLWKSEYARLTTL